MNDIYHKPLRLEHARLVVWEVDGRVCVSYEDCLVKDGIFLKGVFGQDVTFMEACIDYAKKISGHTLVFGSGKDRKEVTVLL